MKRNLSKTETELRHMTAWLRKMEGKSNPLAPSPEQIRRAARRAQLEKDRRKSMADFEARLDACEVDED